MPIAPVHLGQVLPPPRGNRYTSIFQGVTGVAAHPARESRYTSAPPDFPPSSSTAPNFTPPGFAPIVEGGEPPSTPLDKVQRFGSHAFVTAPQPVPLRASHASMSAPQGSHTFPPSPPFEISRGGGAEGGWRLHVAPPPSGVLHSHAEDTPSTPVMLTGHPRCSQNTHQSDESDGVVGAEAFASPSLGRTSHAHPSPGQMRILVSAASTCMPCTVMTCSSVLILS